MSPFSSGSPPPGRRRTVLKDGELYPLTERGVKGSIHRNCKRFSIRRKTIFLVWLDRRGSRSVHITLWRTTVGGGGAAGGRDDEGNQRKGADRDGVWAPLVGGGDRKSTRLNSSHGYISYAVF